MNEIPAKPSSMIETTDCLEAVGVFRSWKNFFFIIVLLCLLIVQVSFWLVDTKIIAPDNASIVAEGPVAATDTSQDPNEASTAKESRLSSLFGFLPRVKFPQLSRVIQVSNGVLVITATLYWLAILFSLMVSLIGRLGGIRHISRAFFLSLIMVVLLVPWQKIMGSNVMGAVYSPEELVNWINSKGSGLVNTILYYLRFSGYWLVVLLLLFMSQMRSCRWTKSILRRLEIM
jgi:hypothetical protein